MNKNKNNKINIILKKLNIQQILFFNQMELQLFINQLYPLVFYYFYYIFFLKNIMNPHYQNIPQLNQMFFNQDFFNPTYLSTQFPVTNVQYNPYYTSFQAEIAKKWNFLQFVNMQNQNLNAYQNQNGHQGIEIQKINQINDNRNSFIPQQFSVNTSYIPKNTSNPIDFYNTKRISQVNVQNNLNIPSIPTKQAVSAPKTKNIHKFDPNTAPLLISEKKCYTPKSIQNIIILDSDDSVKENQLEKQKPIVSNVQKSTNFTPTNDTPTSQTILVPEKVAQSSAKDSKQIQSGLKKNRKLNGKTKKIKKVVSIKKLSIKKLNTKTQSEKVLQKLTKLIKKSKIDLQKQKEREKTKREKKINLEEKVSNQSKCVQAPNKIRVGEAFQVFIPEFILNTTQHIQNLKQKKFNLSQRLKWNGVQKVNIYNKMKQQYPEVNPKHLIDLANIQKQLSESQKNRQTQIKSIMDSNKIENEKQKLLLLQLEDRQQKILYSSETRLTRNNLKNKLTF